MIQRTERREEGELGILPGETVMEMVRTQGVQEGEGDIIIRDRPDQEQEGHEEGQVTRVGQVRVEPVAQLPVAVVAMCQADIIVCTATVDE